MKTVLYYFSGTGNSLSVAREIAAGLGNAQVIAIRKPFKQQYDFSADRVGIVFPVYMWGLPLIVKEFAELLGGATTPYLFAVATYGGFPAGTLPMLAKVVRGQGLTLSAGFGVRMPGNYTPMYGAQSEAAQQKNFTAAAGKIKEIVNTVRAGTAAPVEKNNWLVNAFFTSVMYWGGSKKIRTADTQFILEDSCTKCGLCARVCPAENISLVDGKPTWLHHCEHCLACLQWCPVEAIQYGGATKGRKRYHHPSVTADDFCKMS